MNKYLIASKVTQGEVALAKQSFFLLDCDNGIFHYVQSQITSVIVENDCIYIQTDPDYIRKNPSHIETNLYIDPRQCGILICSTRAPSWIGYDEIKAVYERSKEILNQGFVH